MLGLPSPCSPRLARLSLLVLALVFFSPLTIAAPMKPLGAFDQHQDVGAPKLAGNAVYNLTDQTYTLSGGGPNAGARLEQFHLAWTKIKGDFIVQASVRFIDPGTPARRELGIMVRDSLGGSSRYAAASVQGDTL